MMNSKVIIFVHAALFFSLLIYSVVSSLLIIFVPGFVSLSYLIWGTVILAVVLAVAWYPDYKCPLTTWENRTLEKEEKGSSYEGPCVGHYALKWFNIKLNRVMAENLSVFLIFLPVVIGLVRWLV